MILKKTLKIGRIDEISVTKHSWLLKLGIDFSCILFLNVWEFS
jgi:hypothetical protein